MSSTSLQLAFIDGLGGGEMILIFVIILILFGGQRLPELARGMGKSIREFKKATSGVEAEIKRALEEPPAPRRRPATKPALAETPAITIDPLAPPVAPQITPPHHEGPLDQPHVPRSDEPTPEKPAS